MFVQTNSKQALLGGKKTWKTPNQTPKLLALPTMKPAAQLYFRDPAQTFTPKPLLHSFSLVSTVYWSVRIVALSLWVALLSIWLHVFPLRDLKGSDRSVASLQPSKHAEEEMWLLAKQIQSCQVLFLKFFFLLFCRESSFRSGLGFNGKPNLQLVDIDICYHLAGCCCLREERVWRS